MANIKSTKKNVSTAVSAKKCAAQMQSSEKPKKTRDQKFRQLYDDKGVCEFPNCCDDGCPFLTKEGGCRLCDDTRRAYTSLQLLQDARYKHAVRWWNRQMKEKIRLWELL